jgi:uncharacterized protein YceK
VISQQSLAAVLTLAVENRSGCSRNRDHRDGKEGFANKEDPGENAPG